RACHNIDNQHPDIQLLLRCAALPAIEHQWILDIEAARQGTEPAPFELEATELANVKALSYVVPLSSSSGTLGVCLLSRPTSTEKVNWEDRDLMKAISR
ncbi:hypothetical protein, partial [Photobacterium sp. R1]